ncbi:MAG: ribosome recycling factor [Thermodesulfobacteriota bacterium]|nr:ribosome recycling factor [Thermodesulfobacteriota bacterium]
MKEDITQEARDKMVKSLESFKKEVGRVRTGRATVSLLDGIKVDYYGTMTSLNQLATLSVPGGKLIVIQPWDQNVLSNIEKAIQKSDLGLNPMNDGAVIKINIPSLTEERKKELVKLVKKMNEECRVTMRNIRRAAIEECKRLKKDKEMSEDELFKCQDTIQKMTDENIKKADEIIALKEKEILEV